MASALFWRLIWESTLLADARPEKRLFISLITRDISLIDAFLDLLDNSINAALEPLAANLKTADDYQRLLGDANLQSSITIEIQINDDQIIVQDTAAGISASTAASHVFRFGREEQDKSDETDRLSVYGIGLKRALFKCGRKIDIVSDHREGGFHLNLDVPAWAKIDQARWEFPITQRPATSISFGTKIKIDNLYDDVKSRINDGLFLNQLKERISRTYSFYIGRVAKILLNGQEVEKETFEIGDNYASERFESDGVSCNITAGIAVTKGQVFRASNSGWFVFCNGRAVLFADKSTVTGWGGGGLPIFQPKHRPFLGTVFFVSPYPEMLPWTTTKASLNEESAIWQTAKRHMVTAGRVVTTFLDARYTEDGTEIAPAELQDVAGKTVSVLTAAVATNKAFRIPKRATPRTMKIQYDAQLTEVKKIENYLRRPGMGGSAVGRYTFNHFLENEVGEDE